MKVKLLRKLRKEGRNQIHVYSVTRSRNIVTGMSYGFNEDKYSGLFNLGDTEEEVLEKAAKIYINDYILNHKRNKRK